MTEHEERLYRVESITLAGAGKPSAKCSLTGSDNIHYCLIVEPGETLDVLIEAWARRAEAFLTARSVRSYGSTQLLVDVSRAYLSGVPRGATVYEGRFTD